MGARIDVEYQAFRAGLKPAIRLTASRGQAGDIAARYRSFGCAVVMAEGTVSDAHRAAGHAVDVVYVARTAEDAQALCNAEAPLLAHPDLGLAVEIRILRELGRRLGYPDCCVEACAERYARRLSKWRRRLFGAAVQAHHAARDAWVPLPRWQLNDLLFAARTAIISFEPCSYGCPVATRYADAVLEVITRIDRDARARIESTLRRSVVIAASGARALVTVNRGDTLTLASAEAPRDPEGRPRDDKDAPFAATLTGRRVDPDGSLPGTGRPAALLVDFSRRAG